MTHGPAPQPARWQLLWARWRHGVAALSFIAGVASFALIERQERVAQALVILLPLSWLLPMIEPWLQRLAERRPRLRAGSVVFGYAAQTIHQESLFFTLPFFFATTEWRSPQAVFTAAMIALALVSVLDPIYYGKVVPRRAALWAFHACAAFVTVLTAAPMLWHLTTAQSLQLGLLCLAVVSVPAWHALLASLPAVPRGLGALALGALLGWAGWQARVAIPPATLWVADMRMTTSIDVARREPGTAVHSIDAAALASGGLYAWSSIRVPRGLRERVEHHWIHRGRLIDVIPLEVSGGREAGYRAWSHKTAFPADPRGRWEVRVVTTSGQLIGHGYFTVR
ncbi:DUF5924 family protein [Sinimarinibacterium thermocellulolyticum]|uniref:DUF5924 family protein n=1 Tax=Sinimarinibacterium thermocellulolyticum TaxID=3170016 RepID=A0ABV2ABB5_9GAMM